MAAKKKAAVKPSTREKEDYVLDLIRKKVEDMPTDTKAAKTGYKYSIKFNQSLTSGTIAFEGYYAFDDSDEFFINDDGAKVLRDMLQTVEEVFRAEGYKVASIIPNNMKDLVNRKSELQLAKEVNKLEEENRQKAEVDSTTK